MPSKKQFYQKMTGAAVRCVRYAMERNVEAAINDIREKQEIRKTDDSLTIRITVVLTTPRDGIGSCVAKLSWDKTVPHEDNDLPFQKVDLINEDLPLFQAPNTIKNTFFTPVVPDFIRKWGDETEMCCVFPAFGENNTLPMADRKVLRYFPASGEILENIVPVGFTVDKILLRTDELMANAIVFDRNQQILPFSQKRIDETKSEEN